MDSNRCLVAFASSGRVGTYTCNSAWADQVWGFEYAKPNPYDGDPFFWLRNKHSGRCLALNLAYSTTVFMTTCAQSRRPTSITTVGCVARPSRSGSRTIIGPTAVSGKEHEPAGRLCDATEGAR
jgi:hypothetical protein